MENNYEIPKTNPDVLRDLYHIQPMISNGIVDGYGKPEHMDFAEFSAPNFQDQNRRIFRKRRDAEFENSEFSDFGIPNLGHLRRQVRSTSKQTNALKAQIAAMKASLEKHSMLR